MTTGENVPGDSEIVGMLIVHFQSSIKFNSHSASTCYSNSVTEYTSGMYSYASISTPPPTSLRFFFFVIRNDTPSSLHLLLPLCHRWQREAGRVYIIDDVEHMCASLMRPTNTWSSESVSIHLSLVSSPPPVLALLPSPSLRPSPLSSFPPVQIHLPPSSLSIFFLPLLPARSFVRSFPRCLSLPPLLPNAVRLTTLFPFKIKIIKSAAKWERVCCWRHRVAALMFYFGVIVSTSTHQSQTKCAHNHTHVRTIHAFTHPTFPPTTSHILSLLSQHTQRPIRHAKLHCLSSYFLSSNHSILYCWSHPLLLFLSLPLQTSPSLSFLISCRSPSLSLARSPSLPPPSSWSAGC